MSRPKPEILTWRMDGDNIHSLEILAADYIWTVFYQGKPMNIRRRNTLISYPGPKYPRVAFAAGSGHAFGLKRKLNLRFRTDDFQVYALGLDGCHHVKGDYPGDDIDFFGDPNAR